MTNPVSPVGGTLTPDDPATLSAIRRYEERLAKDSTSLAFAPLADAYRKTGRTGDAIRLCREGLERFPQYVTARLILAKALLDEGDADGALGEVRAILETRPHEAQAHRLAGDLYRRAGDLGEAVRHLEQAVRLDPGDRESRAMLDILGAGGVVPEGSALKQLLADDTFATLSFGTLCLEQGLIDEAAQIFLRLLARDLGHARAREGLEEALRLKTQRRKGS
ncbi:MAG TPA: tetratricopeptide repeat protein [Methylomirabilota bacterium]